MNAVAEPITVEVVAADEQLAVIQQNGLQPDTAKNLQDSFAPLFRNAKSIIEKSRSISVTDASQKLEIKLARECRLALRAVRVESDKTRKSLKEESLKKSRAIDGFHNILLHLTESEEARLEEQENFVERKESERKAALKIDREKALAPFGVDTAFMSLGEMPDETFAQLLDNARSGYEAKLEAARKLEEERIKAENERLKEQARIRDENARLKREAEEREAAAKAEREKFEQDRIAAEAAAKAEREKLEREQALERKRLAAENEAKLKKERAAAAVKQKLLEEHARQQREASEAAAAAERARVAEEQRIAAEKARLEREALERQAALDRAERERLEAAARAAKVEADLKAASEAEAARQAALAPDREKLLACVAELRALSIPSLSTDEGRGVTSLLATKIEKLAAWIEQEAAVL